MAFRRWLARKLDPDPPAHPKDELRPTSEPPVADRRAEVLAKAWQRKGRRG